MAAFVGRDPADRAAFNAHWSRILADERITIQRVDVGGKLAGYVLCHHDFDEPEISYFIGKEFWGKGIATSALSAFLAQFGPRPLFAHAAKDNLASIRVLEKCGFRKDGEERAFANARGQEIDEVILKLS